MDRLLSIDFGRLFETIFPFLITCVLVVCFLVVLNTLLLGRKAEFIGEKRFARRILMILFTCAGGVILILAFPADATTKGHIFSLLGILISAMIAFSSTTLVANVMAGLMVRSVCRFKPGDFIRVEEQYGRVTERGLVHTEIQTEDRDLVTIPNLCLISNPVKVTRESGTIVSADVSLGYDISNDVIEKILIKSAHAAKLKDPFVQVLELGDFSVSYRVAGFLTEVTQIISARSTLRKMILNALHNANIEIVSPSFMNQRVLSPETTILPPTKQSIRKTGAEDHVPEELIFDKAEEAKKTETLKTTATTVEKEVETLATDLKKAEPELKPEIKEQLEEKKEELEKIKEEIRDGSRS